MPVVDIFFLAIFGLAVWNGLRRGLFKVVSSLVGMIVGAWVTSHYYWLIFDWLVQKFGESGLVNRIVIFVVMFFVVGNLVAWLLGFLGSLIEAITIIPLLKSVNRLLGAVFSLLESALSWSLILFFVSRYLPANTWLAQQLGQSAIVHFLTLLGYVLWPLLPMVLKQMQALW